MYCRVERNHCSGVPLERFFNSLAIAVREPSKGLQGDSKRKGSNRIVPTIIRRVRKSCRGKAKQAISKAGTVRIERNNARMRHWFKRFGRKTIAFSRSVEIVDITVGLFTGLIVNGDHDNIICITT